MHPTQLHHLALGAHDVDGLAEFYEGFLGLKKVQTHQNTDGSTRSIWLALGGTAVLMIEKLEVRRDPIVGRASGVFLLCVSMSEEQRTHLRKILDGNIEEESEFTTYFRDLEGNRIAASSYPLDEKPPN